MPIGQPVPGDLELHAGLEFPVIVDRCGAAVRDAYAQLEQRAKREHGARFDELLEEDDADGDDSPDTSS